ncbi:uncharacterized protein [Drosophila tropicalis]|uniref:uncharacterized protein n=1 Tax=Drosophila tropicalis TaxID=46794 RepID=UPI0035AB7B4C
MKAAAGRTNTSGSTSARMTAPPLSSHSTGGRKRQSMASAHGGAGDGGADMGGSESHGMTTTPRLEQPTIASALRAASNRQAIKQQRERAAAAVAANMNKPMKVATRARTGGGGVVGVAARAAAVAAKSQRDLLTAKQATRARLWAPKKASGNAPSTGGGISHMRKDNHKLKEVKSLETLNVINDPATISKEEHLREVAIQTNEAEILDHNLLSGNIRIMTPSPNVVTQIDKCRREAKAKAERQTIRRFTPHEQEEEEHLDKLKEFTDRNAVTKRSPKKPPPITYGTYDHQFSNVFKSMDDFFRSEVPKSESITNIKERIKRKEVELMSLFDNMDNMADKSDIEY